MPDAYPPKQDIVAVDILYNSSSSRCCGYCGKAAQPHAMTGFVPLDKLWVKGQIHPHGCGKNPIPCYIRVSHAGFLPNIMHRMHIFSPKPEKKRADHDSFIIIRFGYPQTHSLWISLPVDRKIRLYPPFFAKRKSYAPFVHIHSGFGAAKMGGV